MNGKLLQYVIAPLLLFSWSGQILAAPQTTSLIFYTESISLKYEHSIILDAEVKTNEASIQSFYNQLEELPFRPLLLQLSRYSKKLELNSYLYSELVKDVVQTIYPDKSQNYKTLINWYLLSKVGLDVRLTHAGPNIYLYSYTREEVYNVPIIKLGNKEFVNLTNLKNNNSTRTNSFYVVEFTPNPYGAPMSFKLDKLPKFAPQPLEKELVFAHRNELYRFEITIDETLIRLMQEYPLINPSFYIRTPLSQTMKETLVPKLKELIDKKDTQEAVQLLLSLTRTAFEYKTDVENFGKNKPMIPDEVLFYTASDCEDRSALFYTLVKELLDLPVIVVDYPEHLTVGVALPQNIGKPLYYRGRQYTICDPTGPSNTDALGIYPEGYEELPYKVALSFK